MTTSTRYLAIRPLDLSTINKEDIQEALEEFGCYEIVIDNHHYAASKSLKSLANMMFVTDLNGAIIEFTGIYDSFIETATTETIEE